MKTMKSSHESKNRLIFLVSDVNVKYGKFAMVFKKTLLPLPTLYLVKSFFMVVTDIYFKKQHSGFYEIRDLCKNWILLAIAIRLKLLII